MFKRLREVKIGPAWPYAAASTLWLQVAIYSWLKTGGVPVTDFVFNPVAPIVGGACTATLMVFVLWERHALSFARKTILLYLTNTLIVFWALVAFGDGLYAVIHSLWYPFLALLGLVTSGLAIRRAMLSKDWWAFLLIAPAAVINFVSVVGVFLLANCCSSMGASL